MFNLLEHVYSIKLELTSMCNSECIMCPKIVEKEKFVRNNHLTFDLFKKIIDEIQEESIRLDKKKRELEITKGKEELETEIKEEIFNCVTEGSINALKDGKTILKLYGYGESLLHPDFIKMLSYLKNKDFYILLATNGSRLNKDLTEKILELDVIREIIFSLDSYNKEEYEAIRKGLKYESVYENVDYFIAKVKEENNQVRIDVIVVKNKENEKELDKTMEFFKSKGINASIETDIFSRSMFDSTFSESCPLLQHTISIYSTGEVVKCGMDAIGISKIGDVNKESLREIWLGEKNLRYLTLNQTGNRKQIEICKKFCIK